ncbi:MAG: hypothetical protein F7B17_08955, partial [Desulfurococcales archaeon]|nr:hypothetical protein [Desulfurococcales archaeon]
MWRALLIGALLAISLASLTSPYSQAQANPWVVIVPDPTPPHDVVVILGDFPPYDRVDVYIYGEGYPRTYIARLYLNPNGGTMTLLGLPRDLPPGTYTLEFQSLSANLVVTKDLRVVRPVVRVEPAEFAPGDVVTVHVTGLAGNGVSFLYLVTLAGLVAGVVTPSPQGEATISFVAPPLPSGSYRLAIVYPGGVWLNYSSLYGGPVVVAETTVTVKGGVVLEGEFRALEGRVVSLEARVSALE